MKYYTDMGPCHLRVKKEGRDLRVFVWVVFLAEQAISFFDVSLRGRFVEIE